MSRLPQEKHSRLKNWLWIIVSIVLFSGFGIWRLYDPIFLVRLWGITEGFWGLTNDEIAVVTIEKNNDNNQENSTETIIITDPSKSFWDGLELLGVPLVLAIVGARLQKSQQEQAEQSAQEQRDQAERVARDQREQDADETREEVLQLYFDRVSGLLVDKNLMAINSKAKKARPAQKALLEASLDVIRARTLSILRRFERDIERKSSVIRFLADAEIVSKLQLDLKEADLQKTILKGTILSEAQLQGANLQGARLEKANLQGANLQGANLQGANLQEANLQGARLEKANLQEARLFRVNLQEASLNEAILRGASLGESNLNEANLYGAKLSGANLYKASLKGVNLYEADLRGVNLYETDLSDISFNKNTFWPPGVNPKDWTVKSSSRSPSNAADQPQPSQE